MYMMTKHSKQQVLYDVVPIDEERSACTYIETIIVVNCALIGYYLVIEATVGLPMG